MRCIGKWVPGDIKCAVCTKRLECKRFTVKGESTDGKGARARRELRRQQ